MSAHGRRHQRTEGRPEVGEGRRAADRRPALLRPSRPHAALLDRPECELHIFASIRFDQNQDEGNYQIDSVARSPQQSARHRRGQTTAATEPRLIDEQVDWSASGVTTARQATRCGLRTPPHRPHPEGDRLPRRVPAEPVSHLEADVQANSGDPQGTRKPSSDARGEAQWAVVTYVPYDPSFETPDEGGPSGRQQGPHSLREQPSRVLVTEPHLLKTVSKGSVDATANGAQRTFRL
jgi:hypothetical protein